MKTWRHHIHAHPETAFEESGDRARSSPTSCARSASTCTRGSRRPAWSACCAADRGKDAIGLRADLDALHIHEKSGVAHASKVAGKMHACGHDGHTTMLLGAAAALARTQGLRRDALFHLSARRGERGRRPRDGRGGPVREVPDARGLRNAQLAAQARRHVRDARGPVDGRVRHLRDRRDRQGRARGDALHRQGSDALRRARDRRAADDRRAQPPSARRGRGQHHPGARRRHLERHPAGGRAARHRAHVRRRGAGADREADARHRRRRRGDVRHDGDGPLRAPLSGDRERRGRDAARDRRRRPRWSAPRNVETDPQPNMGSEDFAFMLQAKPGCYVWLGAGRGPDTPNVHNPHYDFNDDVARDRRELLGDARRAQQLRAPDGAGVKSSAAASRADRARRASAPRPRRCACARCRRAT